MEDELPVQRVEVEVGEFLVSMSLVHKILYQVGLAAGFNLDKPESAVFCFTVE